MVRIPRIAALLLACARAALRGVAAFTEHCGYYFLGSAGLEVEVLETVHEDVPVEAYDLATDG